MMNEEESIASQTMLASYIDGVNEKESLSEEIRVLYVAMTRAKQKLVLSLADSDIRKDITKWSIAQSKANILNAANYMDIIAFTLLKRAKADIFEKTETKEIHSFKAKKADIAFEISEYKEAEEKRLIDAAKNIMDFEALIGEEISKELSYKYPFEIQNVPAKLSVTRLKQESMDKTLFKPQTNGDSTDALLRGNAVHFALRYLKLNGKTAKEQIDDMIKEGSLSQKEADTINISWIENFLESDLVQRIEKSEYVLRETPFSLNISAKEAGYEGDADILVQGIIDLCFLENGEWVLVDYKTDRIDPSDVYATAKRYEVQLNLYERALKELTGKNVKQKMLYFLRFGQVNM